MDAEVILRQQTLYARDGQHGTQEGRRYAASEQSVAFLKNVWPAPSARCVLMAMRSASTYPVSGSCPGQDGYPRASGPHKACGVQHHI